MQKLSIIVFNKMVEQKITGCEIDFLLYISRYQDDYGWVRGVYYKELAKEMDMSYQQFYNVKKSLQEKGIISVEKNNYYDHDITIIDNSYVGMEGSVEEIAKKKPYINTNHNIFFTEFFRNMKPGAKLMALDLMRRTRANATKRTKPYQLGVNKLFDTYTDFLGVTKRVIRGYLTQLRKFFDIELREKTYEIIPNENLYNKFGMKLEKENYCEHQVKVVCQRCQVKIDTDQDLIDAAEVYDQYKNIAPRKGRDLFQVFAESVKNSVDKARKTLVAKEKCLQPKLVHTWIRALLGIEAETTA